jgi:hypothetical protein
MKDRVVSRVMLDDDGISFLFGPWGAVASAKAAEQIESGARKYFVHLPDGFLAEIRVIERDGVKRFHADAPGSDADALAGVPTLGG